MDPAQLAVALLGAGGGGAILLALVNGTFKWLSGASGRERDKNADYSAQRTLAVQAAAEAYAERDDEAATRRRTEEYASALRRQLIENGIQPLPWLEDPQPPALPKQEV